jgi:predicted nucleic acid-binding protein
MKNVVSDSSPLIALLNIQQLDLLKRLFNEIIIPPAVASEIEHGETSNSHWFTLKKTNFIRIESVPQNDSRLAILELQLDRGESEAILLADELKIPLLIDERTGRNMAKTLGLEIIGLVGVLYALKRNGHISLCETQKIVTALEQVHFRMSNDLKALLLNNTRNL